MCALVARPGWFLHHPGVEPEHLGWRDNPHLIQGIGAHPAPAINPDEFRARLRTVQESDV